MGDKKRVLAFGTFDGLHPGHKHYLGQAAAYGDLTVVVARDATVEAVKGRPPKRPEAERLQAVLEAGYHAVLGSQGDKYAVLRAFRPEVICLGYDQTAFTDGLRQACEESDIAAEIVRIDAHKPDIYKSSLLDRPLA
jgi:FAD synthetase